MRGRRWRACRRCWDARAAPPVRSFGRMCNIIKKKKKCFRFVIPHFKFKKKTIVYCFLYFRCYENNKHEHLILNFVSLTSFSAFKLFKRFIYNLIILFQYFVFLLLLYAQTQGRRSEGIAKTARPLDLACAKPLDIQQRYRRLGRRTRFICPQ